MNLKFKHIKPLTKKQVEGAEKIINILMTKQTITSGGELAKHLDISLVEVRKIIQNIREHNNELLDNGLFIIATNKGYELTNKRYKIKKWAKTRQTKAISGLAQVDQAWKITKEKW